MINDRTLTWTFFLVDILIYTVLYFTGAFPFILMNDPSFITLGILGVYMLSNAIFFRLAFGKGGSFGESLEYYSSLLRTTSNGVIMVGFIGTLLGIVLAFYGIFVGIDIGNIQAAQNVIAQMSNGLGVAFITSLAGMVSGLLIHIKLSILGYET